MPMTYALSPTRSPASFVCVRQGGRRYIAVKNTHPSAKYIGEEKIKDISIPDFKMTMISIIIVCTSIVLMTEGYTTESDQKEYVLNLTNNQKEDMKKLALSLRSCGVNLKLPKMHLRLLKNQSITCNDGSPAGYYLRKISDSKRWLVFLQGGTYCYDRSSCNWRRDNSPRLTGSRTWPQTEKGTGILSADPVENPIWWKSNVVMIPYCSSDVWSGTKFTSETGYSFMGSLIIKEVLRELLTVGLLEAKQLVLAGSSAGGTGVLLNLDSIRDWLASVGSNVELRGLVDSGWFLDMEQLKETRCDSSIFCKPSEAIAKGVRLWGSSVPSSCLEMYGAGNEWKCFFGFRIYQTLRTPVYIVQWLYDEAQLTINLVSLTPPTELEEWSYMQKTAKEMRASLKNVSAVFATSCYGHMILESIDWTKIQVRNVYLHHSISCWLGMSTESNALHPHRSTSSTTTALPSTVSPNTQQTQNTERGKSSGLFGLFWKRSAESRRQFKNNRKRRTKKEGNSNNKKNNDENSNNRPRSIGNQGVVSDDPGVGISLRNSRNRCQHHLLDHADCPHCNNPTCPKIKNRYTGEEMDFLQYMRLWGLDVSDIAKQVGVDSYQLLQMMNPSS
ncbi:palmitoleoyl-protein carboxylesterase notum1-like isoform X2 [Anneissia japonica]|uniref:palmitoleoyl-protein carboxylesterase notum1-like isoform X2 n=1 Tax=Anneissia japonica TaxID=1529436 RepID=UPI001425B1B6|nr:palmitoleoyl-protein carboxylesterase notum1-like isoform X2 [Anneissia japonica]